MVDVSRRQMLQLSGAGAAGLAGSLLPPSLHRALASPMRSGGLGDVQHIIVLMQENRSFDHYFGRMRGMRGYSDHAALELPDGHSVFSQPAAGDRRVAPFSLREAAARAGRATSDIQYLGALDHSWDGSSAARGGGWNNGWVAAKSESTMTYYERRDLGLQYELADTFTLCDAYHCSVYGSTNPNRNYLWSGTIGNEPGTQYRAVTNAAYSYNHAGYEWTTYPERLERAGVSWQIYQEWDNFTDNAVEFFASFKEIGNKILSAVDGNYRTTAEFYDRLPGHSATEQQRLLTQFRQGVSRLSAAERSLFRRAMYRSKPDSLLQRVRSDIDNDALPRVSWLVPPAALAEHPSSSTPVGSANLIYDLLDLLGSRPEVWAKTAVLLNFDENDGYFDHVPPPVPPRPEGGNGPDWYDGRPIGLGPRVPMTVISPWTVGGFVNSQVHDHTSVLQLLERWTGVSEPNISRWRREVCGDLLGAFDFARSASPPTPRHPGAVPDPIRRWRPAAPAEGSVPEQEQGRRPARALPYQCSAQAMVGQQRLRLLLTNSGEEAAHLTVFPYAGEAPEPRHLDVLGQRAVDLAVPAERFRTAVHGPNRFVFDIRGSADGPLSGLTIGVAPEGDGLRVRVRGTAAHPVSFTLQAQRYVRWGSRLTGAGTVDASAWLPTDDGWYDLRMTCSQDEAFALRATGHLEDGAPSISG